MKKIAIATFVLLLAGGHAAAQKGIDTQTERIKQDANRTTTRSSDASRSFDWGEGKTKVRERLPNPYRLNARRDVLIEAIINVLEERKMLVDEASSRIRDGIVVTQPYIFAKGPVTAQSELGRYGVIEFADSAWSRARYTLTIEVQPINGIQHNVVVNARVEGRSGNGVTTEWTNVQSSGLAEDEFLALLTAAVTGETPGDTLPDR